jgi:hypothetical protein
MADKSIIEPILAGLEYFNKSSEEISYFYNIIDKFCANWFGRQIRVEQFSNIEFLLVHDLLGEFIRIEENNKRISLWLLAINRVCYNYNSDLRSSHEELEKMKMDLNNDIDSTLIDPILTELRIYERLHLNAGKHDRGEKDLISNFMQWIMAYTNFIYPSLENKMDFYEENMIKAMNFILFEFIKQRSNVKRMAYLVMAIIEACNQYSLQNQNISPEFFKEYAEEERIIPGTEEKLVSEILDRLKNENQKQKGLSLKIEENKEDRKNEDSSMNTLMNTYAINIIDKLIADLNICEDTCITKFNKYISKISTKFLTFNENEQYSFLKQILKYDIKKASIIKNMILETLKKSINQLSDNTKEWIGEELKKLEKKDNSYADKVIKKINQEESINKINTVKLFIMLIILKKLKIY